MSRGAENEQGEKGSRGAEERKISEHKIENLFKVITNWRYIS